ncbi:Trihelix transcription factor GT-2 [Rhynchospora pubera]|uniref:Trihelix transcription factor GT-2 n=1 Tax=Rhynchospora pubera TaxID=906938 RepID=A0AAV8DT59_9POAL|nr:Trihelix transcription factor GT-2 [Rhynchospora pubera]
MQTSNHEELNSLGRDNGIGAIGEELESGGPTSHRWPREETLALLRIRSEMDSAFRDASPKGPLWEEVSRKLAELGYKRSAKKCREKFENVQKYYKRTKDGRAGQKDGKMYRFFAELENLNLATPTPNSSYATVPSMAASTMPAPSPVSSGFLISPIGSAPPLGLIQPTPISVVAPTQNTEAGPLGFTTSSSESDESDSEMTDASGSRERVAGRKRKMMELFEGLVKQVMERQEEMQKLFLETLERREQERMAREDAWRRQETARLNREHEILSHERAMATSRDAALVSFIQRINMQSVQPAAIPPVSMAISTVLPPKPNHQKQQVPPPANVAAPAPKQQAASEQLQTAPQLPPQEQQEKQERVIEVASHQAYSSPVESREIVMSTMTDTTPSSRWPKVEVHALIKLRTELEMRYQENGPKGPMWEEISSGMKRMGYNRSAKRCKEKWENINKYFKRVKESSKKRPEDSKTCPYFHELDALYRKKLLAGNGSVGGAVNMQVISAAPISSKSESEIQNGNGDVVGKTLGQPEETGAKNINGG